MILKFQRHLSVFYLFLFVFQIAMAYSPTFKQISISSVSSLTMDEESDSTEENTSNTANDDAENEQNQETEEDLEDEFIPNDFELIDAVDVHSQNHFIYISGKIKPWSLETYSPPEQLV